MTCYDSRRSMIETLLWTVAAWLSTAAFFVGIPTVMILRGDARAAGSQAVIRQRFFLPVRRRAPLSDDLIGRPVWVESWSVGRRKGPGRVLEIRQRALLIDLDGEMRVFQPAHESPGFAHGSGAATGSLDHERALVIVWSATAPAAASPRYAV